MFGNAIARRWAPQNGHERREFSRLFGPRTARPPPPRFGPKTPKIARSARARSHENFGDKTLANFFFSAPTFFTRICRANFFSQVFFPRRHGFRLKIEKIFSAPSAPRILREFAKNILVLPFSLRACAPRLTLLPEVDAGGAGRAAAPLRARRGLAAADSARHAAHGHGQARRARPAAAERAAAHARVRGSGGAGDRVGSISEGPCDFTAYRV